MSDYVIKNIKITNPNSVSATLHYGLTTDVSLTKSIDANSSISLDLDIDNTTQIVYFKLTTDDYKDSEIVSKKFTYNPLNDIEVSIVEAYDSDTGLYVSTITLSNQSPVDLTLSGIQDGDKMLGQNYSSSNTNFTYTSQDLSLLSGQSETYVKVHSTEIGSYFFYIRDVNEEYTSVLYERE